VRLRRLDDYQGWQVISGGTSILLDPWLTDEPITGSFDRVKASSAITLEQLRSEPDQIAAIALCTAVSDHTRPATLAALSQVPVIGPARAARVARKAGSSATKAIRPGQCEGFGTPEGGQITVTATRTGLPLGLIAVGYLIEAKDASGEVEGRIWLEPHQPTAPVARSLGPVDLALLPMQSVTAMLMPVTAGLQASFAAARAAQVQVIVPTATDPGRDMTGWQRALYRVGRRQPPQADGLGSTVHELRAGESMRVPTG